MSAPRPVAVTRRTQAGDRRTLALLRVPQLIELLKFRPECARRPEEVAQAQRRVACDGAATFRISVSPFVPDAPQPQPMPRSQR